MVATPHRGGCEAQSLALGSPVTLAAPRGPAHRQPLIVPGAAGQSAPPPATGRDTFASPKLRTHHARRLGRSRRLSIDGNVAGVRRAAPPTGRDAGSLASVLRHRLVVVDVSAQAGKQRLLQARSTIAKKAAAVKRNKLARDALGRPGGARAARARARLYTYVARPNAGALAVPAGITLAHDMLTDDDGDIAHEFFVVLARAAACPPRHARTCGETCIHSAFTRFPKTPGKRLPAMTPSACAPRSALGVVSMQVHGQVAIPLNVKRVKPRSPAPAAAAAGSRGTLRDCLAVLLLCAP